MYYICLQGGALRCGTCAEERGQGWLQSFGWRNHKQGNAIYCSGKMVGGVVGGVYGETDQEFGFLQFKCEIPLRHHIYALG